MDSMSHGPNQTWFFVPHTLMIYVNSMQDAQSWSSTARELDLSVAIASSGKLPADIVSCDVLIVPLSVENSVKETLDATVMTLSYAMHLENELMQESSLVNEQRMRRL